MKRIHKAFLLSITGLCLLFMTQEVSAQNKKPYYPKGFRAGLGISTGLPTNDVYSFSLGLDARLQYDITLKTSVTGTTGYTHLFKSNSGDMGLIPFKGGFKSFLTKNFYLQGELGVGVGTHNGMGTTFIWSPVIGFANRYIDANVHYERYQGFDTDQLGIRLAYGFKIKPKKKK